MLRLIGPYESVELLQAEMVAHELELPNQQTILAYAIEEDGYVDHERPVCWIGRREKSDLSTLAIEIPAEPTDRVFPGHLPWTEVLTYQKRWDWPIWIDQSWFCFSFQSIDADQLVEATVEQLCDILQDNLSAMTLTLSTKMEGLARLSDRRMAYDDEPDVHAAAELLSVFLKQPWPDE